MYKAITGNLVAWFDPVQDGFTPTTVDGPQRSWGVVLYQLSLRNAIASNLFFVTFLHLCSFCGSWASLCHSDELKGEKSVQLQLSVHEEAAGKFKKSWNFLCSFLVDTFGVDSCKCTRVYMVFWLVDFSCTKHGSHTLRSNRKNPI